MQNLSYVRHFVTSQASLNNFFLVFTLSLRCVFHLLTLSTISKLGNFFFNENKDVTL